jgi:DNA-binding NtrC family response regulator
MVLALPIGMLHRGRVFIFDDDPQWVEALSDFLVEEGYSVATAPNGSRALAELSRTKPLVVISDLEMPEMNGRQFLVRVRAQNRRLPVIVVTGERVQNGDPSLAGAFRIIRKPIRVEDLLSALAEAIGRRVARLPLQKRRGAAGAVSRSRHGVSRSPWAAVRRVVTSVTSASATPFVVLILIASSLVLVKHWRGVA